MTTHDFSACRLSAITGLSFRVEERRSGSVSLITTEDISAVVAANFESFSVLPEGTSALDDSDDSDDSDGSAWSISSIGTYDDLPPDPYHANEDTNERVCGRCHHTESVVESRGHGWEDYLDHKDMGQGFKELICLSCSSAATGGPDEFYCVDCGYSEIVCKSYNGELLGSFYPEGEVRPTYMDENTRCRGCRDRVERYERESREDNPDSRLFTEQEIVDAWRRHDGEEVPDEWAETYAGELDLEEEYEDNTADKSLRVKGIVQEMGEVLFDIKDKITEGEYLKLMNGLQSVTNEMNNSYVRSWPHVDR